MKVAVAFLLVPVSLLLYVLLETRTGISQPVPVFHFVLALAGVGWLAWLMRERFTVTRCALLMAGVVLVAGFAWWTLGYSRYDAPVEGVVSVGDRVDRALREAELWGVEGARFDGGALLEAGDDGTRRALLLIFYRGHW